jgi:hypothetical protein
MANGRCRMHGGASTGPRTASGLERSRRARQTHGDYSQKARAEAAEWRRLIADQTARERRNKRNDAANPSELARFFRRSNR